HRHAEEALLPGPHLARGGAGDARPAHRADGRRRHQRRALHVHRRPAGRSVQRHALRREVNAAVRHRARARRHVRSRLDQPGEPAAPELYARPGARKAADSVDVKSADPGDARSRPIYYTGKPEWVRFMPGREKAATFLETHRWAAAAGGTMAFTKMEGVTVN